MDKILLKSLLPFDSGYLLKKIVACALFLLLFVSTTTIAFAQDIWFDSEISGDTRWDWYLDSNTCSSVDNAWECQVKQLHDGQGHAIRKYRFVRNEGGITVRCFGPDGWETLGYASDDKHFMRLWKVMQPYILL